MSDVAAAGSGAFPSAKERPKRVYDNQKQQADLVEKQQRDLKDAIDRGGASEKGRVLDEQGAEAENITRDTLRQAPDAKVQSDVKLADGEGGQIDNLITKGDKTVYIETKLTLSEIHQRTVHQLTNAVHAAKPGDSVILQVARRPTTFELGNLQQALGENVYNKVQIVSSQIDLYDAVIAALQW